MLRTLLSPRPRDSFKGDYGHVLIVGGDEGMAGAALLAAEAALRCGAGLVSVATHPLHAASFVARRPELMVRGVSEPGALLPLLARASVLVLGPGLGQSNWSRSCFRTTLIHAQAEQLPIVLDADGLNLLTQLESPEILPFYDKWILTPHAGEAGRLLEKSTVEIQVEREGAVRQLQEEFGGAVILKGQGSLVCTQPATRQKVERCQHGNPGMASGGMGDVLSGVCGALLAQGFDLATSARIGMCVHSKAADLAAAEQGERGLLASDLFPWLRQLLNP
ncbi:MAG: NAD(P)H-hydrate dehydratase [Pseudomonadota bacterium]